MRHFCHHTYPGLYLDSVNDADGGTGRLDGGRSSCEPGSDKECLLAGREPRELKSRTATSRSEKEEKGY